MNEYIQDTVQSLANRFGAEAIEFRGDVSLVIPPEKIVEVCTALRDDFAFDVLAGESTVDYWPEQAPRFHMIYQLYSMAHNVYLGLRVPLDGNAPIMFSVTSVYPNANWLEREVWDMFGIRFEGHPDLRRIIMPYDWEGHPLRKDYPLGYEEVQFTFNFDEIDGRKPYAKE
jgi:NADH-quinone oxidoreductase subunit C